MSALISDPVQSVDRVVEAISLADYAALRAYTGKQNSVRVTGYLATTSASGIAGEFVRDDTDQASADNGGTVIVAANGVRWKRVFDGMVNVQWFGADPTNTILSTAAFAAAIATKRDVWVPNGLYKNDAPITLPNVGQRLIGESKQETYLLTPAGSNHDILRVGASLVEVSGFMFRPGSVDNICVRIYAGWCYLHGNRFLAAAPQGGTAVVLTDQNPNIQNTAEAPRAAFVAGAYTHRIEGNHFGASGYTFARDIDDYSTDGITATKFAFNQHLCDFPVRLVRGGGNLYLGNLYQAATGTYGAKVGYALDLGAGVVGETITGNYIELYTYGYISRFVDETYRVFTGRMNHFDNCGAPYSSISNNFIHEDSVYGRELKNGWQDSYVSATQRIFSGRSGTPLLTLDDANKVVSMRRYASPLDTTLSYTADNQTVSPTAGTMVITGAGGYRVGCALGIAGVADGQELVLLGITWPVTLKNTNARFASNAATAAFGNVAGNVQAMRLVFRKADNTWYEISRTLY